MKELTTAGILLKYAIEQAAGERPVTGYKVVGNVKSLPEINPEPSTHEVTDLSDTEWKRYIPGLKDPGGALSVNVNHTEDFHSKWDEIVESAETAKESGKACWWEIFVPGLTKSFFFAGDPAELGMAGAEVDGVLENTVYITPNQLVGWAVKSTD